MPTILRKQTGTFIWYCILHNWWTRGVHSAPWPQFKIYKDIHNLKEKIHKIEHLDKYKDEINNLERNITIFNAEIIKQLNISEKNVIGFHGQTMYHNPDKKIAKQLGSAQ